ncbi:ATP-binding protein [Gilvimarinus sp. F26214L]|uniref:ATP-binding protein n=1 Tax=Gilvimarinus sp. DZF01 TaxID=3461371 RepID=UPI00404556B6
MRLRTSVAVVLLLLLGLFVALSASLIQTANLLDKSAGELVTAGESIRLAETFKSRLLADNRDAFLYSLMQDPERLVSLQVQRNQIVQRLETLRLLNATKEEVDILDALGQQMASYFAEQEQLRTADIPPLEKYSQISARVDETIVVVEQLIDLNRSQLGELMAQIEDRNRLTDQVAVGLLGVTGLILLGVIYGVTVYAARPLARLSSTVRRYATGDSAARSPISGLYEIREIGRSFNHMADRLEERRQEQVQFIASIAHDLRNPLHSISLVSELLVHKSTEEDRELPSLVLRQVKHLDKLVQDLLESSRIEAGQMDLQLAREDLCPLLKDVVDLHQGTSQAHTFVLELPDEPLFCRCDLGRVSQVLNNLLSNAIKYSPTGGSVRVAAAGDEEAVRVVISDQGVGIPSEDIEKIFKPFYRTAITKGTIPGIGLGLSASRRIIEAHGGRLWVESTPGNGSTFHIELPREPADS